MTPDGEMLFVANADANNLTVLNIADRKNAKPLGFIPTGWYPTSVRFNPKDKNTLLHKRKGAEFQGKPGRSESGTSTSTEPERVHRPTFHWHAWNPESADSRCAVELLEASVSPAARCATRTRFRQTMSSRATQFPRKLGDPSPIKHVIYIIKENRTYDQVLRRHEGREWRAGTVPVPRVSHAQPSQVGPRVRPARQPLRGWRGLSRRARVEHGGLCHGLRREGVAAKLSRRQGLRLPERGRKGRCRAAQWRVYLGSSATRPR